MKLRKINRRIRRPVMNFLDGCAHYPCCPEEIKSRSLPQEVLGVLIWWAFVLLVICLHCKKNSLLCPSCDLNVIAPAAQAGIGSLCLWGSFEWVRPAAEKTAGIIFGQKFIAWLLSGFLFLLMAASIAFSLTYRSDPLSTLETGFSVFFAAVAVLSSLGIVGLFVLCFPVSRRPAQMR